MLQPLERVFCQELPPDGIIEKLLGHSCMPPDRIFGQLLSLEISHPVVGIACCDFIQPHFLAKVFDQMLANSPIDCPG
nr:hypothetical protein [Planctopirus limnophila]